MALACQELEQRLKLTLDPRILITIDIFQMCPPPESLNQMLLSTGAVVSMTVEELTTR